MTVDGAKFKAELDTTLMGRLAEERDRINRAIEEIEEMIAAEERRRGFVVIGDARPLVDRMARLGMPKTAVDRVAALFQAVDDIEIGRPVAPEVQKMLDDAEAAERSADNQLALIRAGRR